MTSFLLSPCYQEAFFESRFWVGAQEPIPIHAKRYPSIPLHPHVNRIHGGRYELISIGKYLLYFPLDILGCKHCPGGTSPDSPGKLLSLSQKDMSLVIPKQSLSREALLGAPFLATSEVFPYLGRALHCRICQASTCMLPVPGCTSKRWFTRLPWGKLIDC